jgi:hypothetical protein
MAACAVNSPIAMANGDFQKPEPPIFLNRREIRKTKLPRPGFQANDPCPWTAHYVYPVTESYRLDDARPGDEQLDTHLTHQPLQRVAEYPRLLPSIEFIRSEPSGCAV